MRICQFWDPHSNHHQKWWKWCDFGVVLLSTFFRREAIFSFYYNNTCFNSALAHLGDLKMTFGTVFLHESVGKVQIYSGTLVWSQYDYFESRGIDFSEITVSNQVFRRSKFLKKHFFWPRRLIFAGNGVFGAKWQNLEWFLEFFILRGTADDQNCPKKAILVVWKGVQY